MVRRAAQVWFWTLLGATSWAAGWLALALRGSGRAARQRHLGLRLARLCRRLGGTFVKAAQILGTRADLLSDATREPLTQLQDRVGPFAYTAVCAVLRDDLGRSPERVFRQLDPYPIASASMAQVHVAQLWTGERVAVKVLRPGIERLVAWDLRLLRILVRLVAWLPPLRAFAPRQAVEELGQAILQQTDLRIEAQHNALFRAAFAADPTVGLPALVPELSSRRVLCMSFVEGRKILDAALDDPGRRELARRGYRLLLHMIFVHGLVHADLHPGNLLVSDGRLVLLDVGLVARISPARRQGLLRLLAAWAAGDVARVAQAVIDAAFVDPQLARPHLLAPDIARLLQRFSAARIQDLSFAAVLAELSRLVRRQGAQLHPSFAVTGLAVAVVEGVGRQLAPDLALLAEALPFLGEMLRPMDAQASA
ncbi:MAG: AarF/ABC1/UbiB kinase family protein [Deltaproteobacteria bacterium]|nr:AarF/ABC1/UbiB kinase family protein [Deltaproteobacteria bacterium]